MLICYCLVETNDPATVMVSLSLSHAPCWFSLLIGWQPWNMEPYLTFDVISVRYKDKGTSLMTSEWRFRPPRPLSLPLRYYLVTLCLYGDLGQINVIARIFKLRKRFRMSQIFFEHGINSLPLVCFRGYGNLSTLSIAIPRLAFGRPWYCNAACGYIPVSASANKG